MNNKHLVSLALLLSAAGAAPAYAISDADVERTAPDHLMVSWTDPDPVDVYVSSKPDAAIGDARRVAQADRDGKYDLEVTPGERVYLLLHDGGDGSKVRLAERVLPLDHGSNFRDLGGYPAAGGKHVRWGMIYRSGASPMLTDTDLRQIQSLGLDNMVDLRSSEERTMAPTRISGIPYTAVGYPMAAISSRFNESPGRQSMVPQLEQVYRNFPTALAPQLRIIFDRLLDGEAPIAYNCSAGQDRTGFVTAMILSALGTPREVIYRDYALSPTYRHPEYEMPKIDPVAQKDNPVAMFFARYQQDPAAAKPKPLNEADGTPYLAWSFDEIEKRWAGVDRYLQEEAGVAAADLTKLRSMYLE